MKRKFLSLFLSLALVLSLIPAMSVTAFAGTGDIDSTTVKIWITPHDNDVSSNKEDAASKYVAYCISQEDAKALLSKTEGNVTYDELSAWLIKDYADNKTKLDAAAQTIQFDTYKTPQRNQYQFYNGITDRIDEGNSKGALSVVIYKDADTESVLVMNQAYKTQNNMYYFNSDVNATDLIQASSSTDWINCSKITNVTPKNDYTTNHGYCEVIDKAFKDAEITVTTKAEPGYELDKITVVTTADSTSVECTDGKFTMPNEPVNVSATFKKMTVKYTAFANRLIAKYKDANEKYQTAVLKLTAKNLPFTGKSYAGAKLDKEAWEQANLVIPSIMYKGIQGTYYPVSETAPTKVGKYTAYVVVDGKYVAQANFQIMTKKAYQMQIKQKIAVKNVIKTNLLIKNNIKNLVKNIVKGF